MKMLSIILLISFIQDIFSENEADCYQCIFKNYLPTDYKYKDCTWKYADNKCVASAEAMGSRCSGEYFKINCVTGNKDEKAIEDTMSTYTQGQYGTSSQQVSYEIKLIKDSATNLFNPENFYTYWERSFDNACNIKAVLSFTNYQLTSDDVFIVEIVQIDGKDTKSMDLNQNDFTGTKTIEYPVSIDVYYYSKQSKDSLPFSFKVDIIGEEECDMGKDDQKIPAYAWVSLALGIALFFTIIIVCCCCCCRKAMYRRQIILGADGLPVNGIQMGVNGDVNIYQFDPNAINMSESELALKKEELIAKYKKHLLSNKVAIEKFQQKQCPICMEIFKETDKKELFFTDCGQFIHFKCMKKTIKEAKTLKCPFCNGELTLEVNNPNKPKKKAEYEDLQIGSSSSREESQKGKVLQMKENKPSPDDQTDDKTGN